MFAGDEQALWALEAGASGSSVRVVLTTREREVLLLLAQGQGVAAIARPLYFSQSTTKSHISRFCEKLGAANRAQAMANAFNLGLSPRLRYDLRAFVKGPNGQNFLATHRLPSIAGLNQTHLGRTARVRR